MRTITTIIMASIGAMLTVHAADNGEVATSIYLAVVTIFLLVAGRPTPRTKVSDVGQQPNGGLVEFPQVGKRYEVIKPEGGMNVWDLKPGDTIECIPNTPNKWSSVHNGIAIYVRVIGREEPFAEAILSMLDEDLKLRPLS